jgi:hypothetical protein
MRVGGGKDGGRETEGAVQRASTDKEDRRKFGINNTEGIEVLNIK